MPGCDTADRKKVTVEYIREQLEEDYASAQIDFKEFTDLFTVVKNKLAGRQPHVNGKCDVMHKR